MTQRADEELAAELILPSSKGNPPYVPVKSKLQHPPRAFDCASCPGRGKFERCLGRAGNLNRIYLLFKCNTPVSFLGFAGFDKFTR